MEYAKQDNIEREANLFIYVERTKALSIITWDGTQKRLYYR